MSRKSRNRRGPSEARRKENDDQPAQPLVVVVPPSTGEPSRYAYAIAARGQPLTEAEIRNRAEALRRAKGD